MELEVDSSLDPYSYTFNIAPGAGRSRRGLGGCPRAGRGGSAVTPTLQRAPDAAIRVHSTISREYPGCDWDSFGLLKCKTKPKSKREIKLGFTTKKFNVRR